MTESGRTGQVEEYFGALGRAVHHFMSLEWAVIWLTEALTPGSIGDARHCTARELAERLEDAVALASQAPGEHARLIGFANRFSSLVAERDRLLHAHPLSGSGDTPQILFSARVGRTKLSRGAILKSAGRFEEAIAEALLLTTIARRTDCGEVTAPGAVLDLPPHASDRDLERQKLMADSAATTRARLVGVPGVSKLPVAGLEIYILPDFLPQKDCRDLVRLIDADLVPSTILSTAPDPTFRTSKSCHLPKGHTLVRRIDKKIAALLGIDPDHSETIQGQRYQVGQEFKPHHDYFHPGQYYSEEMDREGGQRTWTAMVFLNSPEEGGCTNFPQVELKIEPRRGLLVVWNNMDAFGAPNPCSLHQGLPVGAGEKYVITKWFRERRWVKEQDSGRAMRYPAAGPIQ